MLIILIVVSAQTGTSKSTPYGVLYAIAFSPSSGRFSERIFRLFKLGHYRELRKLDNVV